MSAFEEGRGLFATWQRLSGQAPSQVRLSRVFTMGDRDREAPRGPPDITNMVSLKVCFALVATLCCAPLTTNTHARRWTTWVSTSTRMTGGTRCVSAAQTQAATRARASAKQP